MGETAGELKHLAGPAEIDLLGTCGVHDVSVGLMSTAGLHADAHILPLGQSALGGEVAGYVRRNYRLVWQELKTFNTRHYNEGWGCCNTRAQTIRQ